MVNIAWQGLPGINVPVPIWVAPSKKLTVPMGIPAAGATGAAITVKVTGTLRPEGFALDMSVMDVLPLFTVCVRVPKLGLLLASPLYKNWTMSVPVASVVMGGKVPTPFTRGTGVPKFVPFTTSCTAPVGVTVPPPVSASVAVKVTPCPDTDGFAEEVAVVLAGSGSMVIAEFALPKQPILSVAVKVNLNVPVTPGLPTREAKVLLDDREIPIPRGRLPLTLNE